MLVADIAIGLLVTMLSFVIGFTVGYGFRPLRSLLDELRQDFDERKAIEDAPDSAVADSSPGHLRAKREVRLQSGDAENWEDDSESQIVNTKTSAQFAAEADAAKEEKLDKWMPGAKRGK